ncbi:IclR family transcriptional regulator [Streptomyces rugosispiralis]|uniref:IclR family transcriptional regulator n=1 Tax=Streptomyces rugosispiralis TaxID=2967341 RepID=A0ABT1UU58_9ACTN|nr:IclR family transcriptional regulator [Streptomyces rugosispiralis]MCQ8187876.1 IclR family transcriptional regulator [Streptomyces rugosispiralis]
MTTAPLPSDPAPEVDACPRPGRMQPQAMAVSFRTVVGGQPQKRPAYLVASVDNALRLLQLLRDEGRLQLKDAARELGVAQSTAHRLLSTLVYRGFAVQDEHRAYLPGPGMGNGPAGLSWARQLRNLATPHLENLSNQLGETVNLMIRGRARVRFLLSIEADNILRIGDRQGAVLPARYTAGGKALLAELDRPTLRRLYRGTDSELVGEQLDERTFGALLTELGLVRRNGHAISVEQTEAGVADVGMVIVAHRPTVMAAFSVATPRTRFRSLFESNAIELMHHTRRELERELRAHGLSATG